MNYSLGNMLCRGGSLNADGLSLDLQFATDKTLTARKGPTPTFTRASAATYYGPLVDFASITAFSTTGVSNSRGSWFKSQGGEDITISYTGTQWKIFILSGETETEYFAAAGSEWRPDQANWSASGAPNSVTTSSTFGIVRAGTNEPRFDHATTSPNASRGLLLEESRTNLALQSENHPSATWSKTGITVASATNTSPSGSTTSNLVSEDSSTGLHRIFQSTAYVSGTSYAISVFLKYAGRQFVAITHPAVASNNIAIFDIQNGTISLTQSGVTASIIAHSNGWYRCIVNGVSATTGGASHIIQGSTTGNSLTGSYTGLNGAAFYIYGSQVEAGGFPTSYIPTTTASVVRSADLCSITGADFTGFYNQSEGTIVGSGSTNALTTNAGPLLFKSSDGTENNRIQVGMTNSPTEAVRPFIVASGTTTYNNKNGTATVGVERKVGTVYKTDDAISAFNGTLGTLDTTVTLPTNCNNASLFTGLGTGTISSFRYYKKRLSNAKLQALTTL